MFSLFLQLFVKLSTGYENSNNTFRLPILFQYFFVALFYRPDKRLDSEEDVAHVCGENLNIYLKTLTDLSSDYCKAVITYIKNYKRERNASDRQNNHHLIERPVHTLALFWYGRLAYERIMEVIHEIFKS